MVVLVVGVPDSGKSELAENVAHFHHERWNGEGYPLGLKGEEIPFEARIMARSLKLSPAAIVSHPQLWNAFTVVSLDCGHRMR